MTDTKFPSLSPGDAAPSYDPAIYGKSLTYEEIAARMGELIFIDNNWWDGLEDKDADAAVMRVVDKTDGYIVLDDGDGLIRLYRQQMLPDVHGGYFKVWAVKTEQEDVSPAPAPVPQEVTAPVPDEQTFSIESPYFAQLRADLDAMLQKVVTQLLSKDSDEASVTLKLAIGLAHTSDVLERAVILPVVEHKISTVITVKDEVKGRSNGDCELIFDAAAERYLLRGLPHDEQLTLI